MYLLHCGASGQKGRGDKTSSLYVLSTAAVRVARLGDISPFGLRNTEICDIYLMKCNYRHLGNICLEMRDILAI